MENDLIHKLYLGFRGFMMRIPPSLAAKVSDKASGIEALRKAGLN